MRVIFILLITFLYSFSAQVKEYKWESGETFLTFLQKNNIPKELYFNGSSEDQELCSEINAGIKYQILYSDDNSIKQILIPISEEMQIHILKKDGNYILDFTPVKFSEFTQTIAIPIETSPYQDILNHTKNKKLANEFMLAFRKSVNFKRLRKGDFISIKYKQRVRMGKYYGSPKILAAMVEVRKRAHFIFMNKKDNRYYDERARSLTSFFMKVPLKYTRISSKFTLKRYHPILKRYRAHLGIDYAAPKGRPIYATADGKIIHKGNKGGYGKTIEIRHSGGYKSLYAHMSKYSSRVKRGQYVKQGQLIGYVGSTGRSTGPHLHFGLYKNGRAVNPAGVLTVAKNKLKGKTRRSFVKNADSLKRELVDATKKQTKPVKLENFESTSILEV